MTTPFSAYKLNLLASILLCLYLKLNQNAFIFGRRREKVVEQGKTCLPPL